MEHVPYVGECKKCIKIFIKKPEEKKKAWET